MDNSRPNHTQDADALHADAPRAPGAPRSSWLAALCLAGAIVLGGCANGSLVRYDRIAQVASTDKYLEAAQRIRKEKDLYGSQSRLLYNMDLGLLYHYAGEWDSSIVYLSKAVGIHDELFAKSVTNEAAAFLTNDNIRPYRGRSHELVLLHQFLAFNYLAKGRLDDARVEARQGQILLDEIRRKAGPKDYRDDGMFRYFTALTYEAGRERDDAAISYYQAVKAYREGPVALPPAVARQARASLMAAGRENDIQELGLSSDPPSGVLVAGKPAAPIAAGAAGAAGSAPAGDGGEIIVVGHAGRSPTLDQNVFWGTWVRDGVLVIHYRNPQGEVFTEALPAPGLPPEELKKSERGRKTRSGTTLHIKFAMPEMKSVASRTSGFMVAGAGLAEPIRTEAVTDLDGLLRKDLDDHRTATLTRTVVRVVLRTIASEQTKEALSGNNPLLNLVLNIGTDVLADQLEQADARCWFLLPRTVQVARIPVRPGVHSLTVAAQDGSGAVLNTRSFDNVEVKPGQTKYLFVSSLK